MNKTAIEWCNMTWNPVTGCLHDCPYCYARKIAMRFTRQVDLHCHNCTQPRDERLHEKRTRPGHVWPYGFAPTFRPYKLREPQCAKKPQRIFVCSMADLFGDWVPDEWIQQVFKACEDAPWHKYLFLTKNPKRYYQLGASGMLPAGANMWYGTTTPTPDTEFFWSEDHRCFVSIEPIQEYFSEQGIPNNVDWVIIGAETGNRKSKIVPKRYWIESLEFMCREAMTPIFMKNSLAPIWGEPLIQEWPEGLTCVP